MARTAGAGILPGAYAAMRWWPFKPARALQDPAGYTPVGILLASEGRPITQQAIDFATDLARRGGAPVTVLSIARVWGSAFGLPNPGLLPSKREWEEQRGLVLDAVTKLKTAGVEASGRVVGARGATQRIVSEAQRLGCDAIVMAADPERHWLVGDFLWSQEPYRVRRKARVPVFLVIDLGRDAQ